MLEFLQSLTGPQILGLLIALSLCVSAIGLWVKAGRVSSFEKQRDVAHVLGSIFEAGGQIVLAIICALVAVIVLLITF